MSSKEFACFAQTNPLVREHIFALGNITFWCPRVDYLKKKKKNTTFDSLDALTYKKLQ